MTPNKQHYTPADFFPLPKSLPENGGKLITQQNYEAETEKASAAAFSPAAARPESQKRQTGLPEDAVGPAANGNADAAVDDGARRSTAGNAGGAKRATDAGAGSDAATAGRAEAKRGGTTT